MRDAPSATSILPIERTRIWPCALAGAICGLLIGFFLSSSACRRDDFYCYPTQELVVFVTAAAGLVVGPFASRLRQSMNETRKDLMTAATLFLLVVLVIASYNRWNPFPCPDGAMCQYGDNIAST